MTIKTCIIFGVSGIAAETSPNISSAGTLEVVGVSRHPPPGLSGIEHRSCDLNNPDDVRQALQGLGPISFAFYATWSRQANEHANCLANGAMFRNAIHAVAELGGLEHVAWSPVRSSISGRSTATPRPSSSPRSPEGQPRVPGENFYYVQEDILFDAAGRFGFHWSVARPHTIIGYAPGNAMNSGRPSAVFATLVGRPAGRFAFPGRPNSTAFSPT